MIELGPASDDEMVLAFLRAEIDSPKWGRCYSALLHALRLERSCLVDAADLFDAHANCARKVILGAVRGYGRGKGLFQGFPPDTKWRRLSIGPSDFHLLKYISKDDRWSTLSRDTRLVQDGAGNLDAVSDIAIGVRGTVKAIKQGLPMAELILVEPDGGMLVVVEGHTRATAYAVLSDRPFPAFVGTSPLMMQWSFI